MLLSEAVAEPKCDQPRVSVTAKSALINYTSQLRSVFHTVLYTFQSVATHSTKSRGNAIKYNLVE